MRIDGTYTIPAPRQIVWQGLLNPEVLARALPGCEKLEPHTDGSYHAEMSVGIAAVKGRYHGRVEIFDPVPPERFRMKIDGQGTGGFLKGEGALVLSEQGEETVVKYSGEAQVGGIIASVGQRLIQGAAKQIVNHFFESFSREIAAPSAAS